MSPESSSRTGGSRGRPGPRAGSKARGDGDAQGGRGPRRRPAAAGKLGALGAGERIYLLAAILLFVLMFFDWYGVKVSSAAEEAGGLVSGSGGGSAWDALEVIPLFLMLAIVVAVGSASLRLARSTWRPAIPPAAAVCVLGLLASLLILIRIVWAPGPDGALSELAFDTTLKLPVFLALAAALGIAYGGWRAMGEEGASFAGIAKGLESPRRPGGPGSPAGPDGAARPERPTRTERSTKPKRAARGKS